LGVNRVTAPPPTGNYRDYREACAEWAARPPAEWAFKRDARYQRILEHVTGPQAHEFLAVAQEAAGNRWPAVLAALPELVDANDGLGAPQREQFDEAGVVCSPSNLRYLCHAVLLLTHLARLGLARVRVYELGPGYGGLALYVHRLAPAFGPKVQSYALVDLPEPGALQAAYCRALGLPVRVVDGTDADALTACLGPDRGAPRVLVSNYAFSEFDADTRAWYEARLVRKCAHGMMVWNFAEPLHGHAEKPLGGPLYPFTDATLTVEPERPCTGPGNVVVTW
jgi:hypothetical protein